MGKKNRISLYDTDAKLPMVQKMIFCISCLLRTINNVITADIKKLTAIPVKRRVSFEFRLDIPAIPRIRNRVSNAVINAGIVIPKMRISKPKIKAIAAPKEAPEEIPKM